MESKQGSSFRVGEVANAKIVFGSVDKYENMLMSPNIQQPSSGYFIPETIKQSSEQSSNRHPSAFRGAYIVQQNSGERQVEMRQDVSRSSRNGGGSGRVSQQRNNHYVADID